MELKKITFLIGRDDSMSIFTHFDANYGDGYYSAIPTTEGSDVMQTGDIVHHHQPETLAFKDGNLIMEVYDAASGNIKVLVNGKLIETRYDNAMGGENIYSSGGLSKVTIPNVHSGIDVYGEDMQHYGMTMPNMFGGEDYLATNGNATTMLSYQDPLAHASEFISSPFDITKV